MRPINVDVTCGLRVMGYSKDSFTFTSDEGDGYDITSNYLKGEKYAPKLKPEHFEEWADQLEIIVEWCRKKAKEINNESKIKKYIVRIYDGFDNEWTDVSKPCSKDEAQRIWNEKTNNGKEKTCYGDIDYYKIFEVNS